MRTPSLLILMVSLLFTGCPDEDPPIIPPPPATQCEYPAGNRNYSWRLDTVAWFPSTLGGIHAFSDSDAYLMGYIIEAPPSELLLLGKHWNGNQWTNNINGTISDIKHTANDVAGDHFFLVSVGYWGDPSIKGALAEFNNQTKKWKGYQFLTAGELRTVWTDGNGYFIAAGDNGMIYIKDGYTAGWVYQKAPTEFNFFKVNGISKNEIYLVGYLNLPSGEQYLQIYAFKNNAWIKYYDSKDSVGQKLPMQKSDYPGDIAGFRCAITDSLTLFVIGDQSYMLTSDGHSEIFTKTNLETLGLPLKQNRRTGLDVNAYSPNDVWIFGTRYNFYHWNGSNFTKVVIPGLPNNDVYFGEQRRMIKTKSGKLFLPTEVSSQVYVVAQGTPK